MIALVFPGQGSQRPGMGADLAAASREAAQVYEEVETATGVDVRALCAESDEETLRRTENAQIALFACEVAALRAFEAALASSTLDKIGAVAGHSIGEYAAGVAAGMLTVSDGARLVMTRGRLMAESGMLRPGTMAAVIGLDRELLELACAEAAGVAVVANDNSPGQLVISGEVEAVRLASELAKAKGAKRVIPLNVSGAFHSPLMAEPAKHMGEALREVQFRSGNGRKLYSNVTAEPVVDPAEMQSLLERQLSSPVRWTETIRNLVRDGADIFVELGAGEVLCGLIRRIDSSPRTAAVQEPISLAAVAESL